MTLVTRIQKKLEDGCSSDRTSSIYGYSEVGEVEGDLFVEQLPVVFELLFGFRYCSQNFQNRLVCFHNVKVKKIIMQTLRIRI